MASQGYRNKFKAIAGGAAKNCGPHYYNKKKKKSTYRYSMDKKPMEEMFSQKKNHRNITSLQSGVDISI